MMKQFITQYLLDSGYSPHYKGFHYLRSALMFTTLFDCVIPLQKVYQVVAQEYECSWQSVERCVRTVIRARCKSTGNEHWDIPESSHLIADLTVRIRLAIESGDS